MNNLICISGKITGSTQAVSGGGYSIVDKQYVTVADVMSVKKHLESAIEDWQNIPYTFCDPIISVRHCRVIPKSKRIQGLFKIPGRSINTAIVGAHFENSSEMPKHVMVYRLPVDVLLKSIDKLDQLISTLNSVFDGRINSDQMKLLFIRRSNDSELRKEERNKFVEDINKTGLSASVFGQLIQDVSSIESIFIDKETKEISEPSFVSLYETGLSLKNLLSQLDLPLSTTCLGSDTDGYALQLTPAQYQKLVSKYPYLISMSLVDISTMVPEVSNHSYDMTFDIPEPGNEPIVGVIDTDFDDEVPFAKWVDYQKFSESKSNSNHGTAVSSLIVDGPLLNPQLEDGCGRFRVRHFSVINSDDRIHSLDLFQKIDAIVRSNRDIKVWNLSLGTEQVIEKNSVSPVGALLDRLQAELDIIFVVAGTNNSLQDGSYPLVGSPADSINSIVVNSVDEQGNIPEYARKGPVLDFFYGPSLSAVGGSARKPLYVFTGYGKTKNFGTSYAACWVTRKTAYLMHKLNLTREVAKALLIDSAYGWNTSISEEQLYIMGAGILPQHISDIIYTSDDEFKVIIRDTCTKYMTYGYNIPIPLYKGKFPFFAKATLCYFPWCSRRHGVDYTLTELDLHFGQMSATGVKSIDNNHQGDEGKRNLPEYSMKKDFRKWDCVKHICEGIKPKSTGKSVILNKEKVLLSNQPYSGWGFYLLKKQRFDNEVMDNFKITDNIPFGLVLTFKSIDKRNRSDDFRRFATIQGWTVTSVDVEVMAEILEEGEIEIDFTE